EGTYVSNVIVPLIRTTLFDNPFRVFISTSEHQSVASADKKGDEKTGRRPDIMFVCMEDGKFYELMYSECSRITCTKQKEDDDDIKLWREPNDGMYWTHKVTDWKRSNLAL
ncbi:20973_t:CDS:2, partial [Gigaspora rosea]